MAESQAVAKQALEKLEDQLTCAICLDAFKDPKLLQCFHIYCKDCLLRLVVTDRQGQLSLRCPTCRQSTLLPPATGVSGLQPAFHIPHLYEIQETLEKVKEPQKVQCEKCKKSQTATKFCRDCGKFVCEKCVQIHSEWEEFSYHEVVSLEQILSNVEQLVPPVILCCSLHQGKELDLYCETCGELICLHCTVKKHKDHQYDLVGDTFERHKAEITASLGPVENQLGVVTKALEQLDVQSLELDDLQATIEANIQQQIRQLQELLEARKAELIDQLQQLIQVKKKNLAAQKDEVKTVHTQLASCLSFVRESLRTGSKGEVMKMKEAVVKQIKEMTDNFKSEMLPPCEPADVNFTASSELASACQQFGRVYLRQVSPEKCHATGKGLEVAKLGERATAVLSIVDSKGKAYTKPMESMTCELVFEKADNCSLKKIEASGQYEISYQATNRGRHQLHIKVEGEHIKGSPFPVTVVSKFSTPIKTVSKLNQPWGVVISSSGNIIVAEYGRDCISIFNQAGKKINSFGSSGSKHGQFKRPEGVVVDDEDNIVVADFGNNRVQKFTASGKLVSVINSSSPVGLAIHPHRKKVYVVDHHNDCIRILNSDLTFSSSFGNRGSGDGQFKSPYDVAFDGTGNVYVADYSNNRIHVLTVEGQFLRKFGNFGSGNGELYSPCSICIDSEDMVYVAEYGNDRVSVFTCEGKFLTSFGTSTPYGIALDKHENLYVTDNVSGCIQIFRLV